MSDMKIALAQLEVTIHDLIRGINYEANRP